MYQYGVCVSEGAHYILGRYGEGVTLEKIRRYALTPSGSGGAAWLFAPISDFVGESGFRRGVILPEIEQGRDNVRTSRFWLQQEEKLARAERDGPERG